MKFDERFIEQRLRSAAVTETLESEEVLLNDLYDQLTSERLDEGVDVAFGDQRETFERVLDKIGLTGLVWAKSPSLHIHNVVVQSGSTTSFLGRTIPEVGNTSLVDLLDVLQADHWTTETDDIYPYMKPQGDTITSKIIIVNSDYDVNGRRCAVTGSLGVVIGVVNRYLPDFDSPSNSLAYFFRDNELTHGIFPRDVIGPLVAELAVTGLTLMMPSRKYFLRIGPLTTNPFVPMGTIDNVTTTHHLQIRDGHVVPTERV